MKYRFDSSKGFSESAAQPHFDDERTLLTARPVVPLEKIDAKARHRKQWFLGGAFAVAIMLGAASALLASYLKLRNGQQAPAQVTQTVDVSTAAPVAVAENPQTEPETPVVAIQNEEAPPTEDPAIEDTTVEGSIPVESTPKKQSPAKRRPEAAARHDDYVVDESDDDRRVSEDDQLHRIREAVLYDEWQERRARRATRRERRRAERYNHRDLSNLDEIFEGRRRPNP